MHCTFSTVFENHRKSLIQHCERSELRLYFWVNKSSLSQKWFNLENVRIETFKWDIFGHFQTICLSSKLMYYVSWEVDKVVNCWGEIAFIGLVISQLGKLKTVKGDLLTHFRRPFPALWSHWEWHQNGNDGFTKGAILKNDNTDRA